MNKFCSPPVRTTEPSCACLMELRTEFEIEQIFSMQLRNKITEVVFSFC